MHALERAWVRKMVPVLALHANHYIRNTMLDGALKRAGNQSVGSLDMRDLRALRMIKVSSIVILSIFQMLQIPASFLMDSCRCR
jgi:hypothetical protein